MSTTAPNSYVEENMQPRIQILGAGIAGLSLACHLRLKQIPFKIFDAAPKPKGHNYGITILPEAYKNLLPALEGKPDISSFTKLTAVDRLVEGKGIVSPSDHETTQPNNRRLRVSDSSLRDLLSQNQNIKWHHDLTSTQPTPQGLKLTFSNGQTSTAAITIDAAGERSKLTSLLLPDLRPTILPYAVYHGSRYLTLSAFDELYSDLFPSNSNVSEHVQTYTPPYPSSPQTKLYIQLSKSHINHASLPSSLKSQYPPSSTLIELRYTLSRASFSLRHLNQGPITDGDPLFNPTRSASEAKTIPPSLYTELSSFLSQNSSLLPQSVNTLLSPSTISEEKDRVLNWLLRLKIPSSSHLESLAEKGVLVIGDAAHSLPILGSEGASLAMEDGRMLAEWLGKMKVKDEEMIGKDLIGFYTGVRKSWDGAEERSRRWLKEVHCQEEDREGEGEGESKL